MYNQLEYIVEQNSVHIIAEMNFNELIVYAQNCRQLFLCGIPKLNIIHYIANLYKHTYNIKL